MGPSARLLLLALALAPIGALLPLPGCGGSDEDGLLTSPRRIDFGRMLHGDVAEQTLTVANRGTRDVSITHASTNCACFQLHPFARLLHPGQERALTVRFASSAVPAGPMRGKHVDLVTSDPEHPHLQVEIVGEIVPSIVVVPATVDLGLLGAPRSLEAQLVQVRPGPGMDVDLVRHRCQPEARLEVGVKEVDGGFDLSVRWKPPEKDGQGRFLGSLELHTRVSGAGFEPRELEHVVRIQGWWPPR